MPSTTDQQPHEMNESLGVFLRKAREEKNVSIEQVAYATRISLKMLRALEEDDHTALPAPTFVRGYLQAYAKYVRLDAQDLLLRYQHHLATAPDNKRGAIRSHYLYVRERYQEKRRMVFVIVLFALMLSVAGAYFFLKAQRDKHKRLAKTAEQIQKSEDIKPGTPPGVAESPLAKDANPKPAEKPKAPEAPPPEEKKVEEKKAEEKKPQQPKEAAVKVAPPPAPTPALPPPVPVAVTPPALVPTAPDAGASQKKNFQLALKASEDVWFRYQTDEEEVKDLTLRAGKVMMLRANKVFKIFSGNLGALSATLNGKEISTLGNSNKGTKSAVLPESEVPNYKLPLFPQFQTKKAKPVANAEQEKPAADAPAPEKAPETPPSP